MVTTCFYRYRHLAHVVLEARSPLVFGNGEKDIISDSMIAKDVNELPYIPGTTLAGTLRHAVGESVARTFFGHKEKLPGQKDEGKGSEIIFSEARLLGPVKINGEKKVQAMEGLRNIDWNDDFYRHFKDLPVRQHVRINYKGVADDKGKFDEQVIYKGARFCFNIEILSDKEDSEEMSMVLDALSNDSYTLGAGSRSGFGKIDVVSIFVKTFDLAEEPGLDEYLDTSSSLNEDFSGWESHEIKKQNTCLKYELKLEADEFFLFSSGKNDDEADIIPVKEEFISWENGWPEFKEAHVFIPASSLKGALAHRTAYWYNKKEGNFADRYAYLQDFTGKNNKAVKEIFGSEGENGAGKARGKALFSDIFDIMPLSEKLMNHVALDRFTGGALDGALFSEKVVSASAFEAEILITDDLDDMVLSAFEAALKDLCSGMLPLGGGTNRGHGFFTGSVYKVAGDSRVLIYSGQETN